MDPSTFRVETEAERLARREIEADRYLARVNRPYVKSFTNGDGEIIDCVRFEDQLGFDPIRDAHILKQVLSVPETKQRFKMAVLYEKGSSSGKMIPCYDDCCPKGTVPIRRISKEEVLRFDPIESHGIKPPAKPPTYLSSLIRCFAEGQPYKPSTGPPLRQSKSES